MRPSVFVLATAIVFAASNAAWAQDAVPAQGEVTPPQDQTHAPPPEAAKDIVPQAAGRFSFTKVEGGVLRLDSATGHMSFCSPHTVGWACAVVPEDRAALDAEIARLQSELAKLKDEIVKAEPPRPPADIPPPQSEDKGQAKDQGQTQGQNDAMLRFPSRDEMEHARAALERAWRRLVETISEFQKDLTKKN
ncbi:MAG: hypothetical protein JSR61_15545 [Proteobacteria bacterium]|nr:hypothetical protein [Pseudomonadota bacterium]